MSALKVIWADCCWSDAGQDVAWKLGVHLSRFAVSAKRLVSYPAFFLGLSLALTATPASASIRKVINEDDPDAGGRYLIEGVESLKRNAKVCTAVQADGFLELFVSRSQGK